MTRRRTAIPGLRAIGAAIAIAGCSTPRLALHGATAFDELMPRPVKVEAAATDETSVVPVAALGNVTMIRGQVPGAPAATADEAYVLEIGSDGVKITASGPFGEIWAEYCRVCGAPADGEWLSQVKDYEKNVLVNRV